VRKDGRTKVGGCSLVLGRLETGTSDRLDKTQKRSYAVWLIAFNVGYRAMQVVLTGYGGKVRGKRGCFVLGETSRLCPRCVCRFALSENRKSTSHCRKVNQRQPLGAELR